MIGERVIAGEVLRAAARRRHAIVLNDGRVESHQLFTCPSPELPFVSVFPLVPH